MANRVNPPKQLVLPPSIAENPELKKAFDDRDFILFQLWKRVGAGEDIVDDSLEQVITALGAQLKELQDQVGSGELLTVDTTSWTVDTTKFWADETEA
jgi:hypothetical protein